MFYISPWMLLGLILCTVYIVLVLLGYDENRHENKTREKSKGKLVSSRQNTKDVSEGKQVETTSGEPDEAGRREEFRPRKSDSQKQIGEDATLSSCQPSDTKKSFDGSKLAPAGSEDSKNFVSGQSIEASNDEDVLQSQDTLYLQEFNVSEDFIVERKRMRTNSQESDCSTEIPYKNAERSDRSGSLEAVNAEVTESITQSSSELVSSVPADLRFGDNIEPENEQPAKLSGVKESNSTTDLDQPSFFEDFADILVISAQKRAFYDIDLNSKANYLAEKLSAEVVSDAIGQFSAGSVCVDQEVESPDIQELHSFAGSVVDSLIQEASGNVSIIDDFESFAKDVSEQIINEGMENFAVMEKLRQGRKQKVSLNEMKIFSEGIISEVVSDGIDEAVGRDTNIKECTSVGENLTEGTDNLSHKAALSSSLHPHISGIVENLVNGAIYEASLRVKAQNSEPKLDDSRLELCTQEILETQVNETVQELIVSALQQAVDYKGRIEDDSSLENKTEIKSHMESFIDETLDAAVNEAAGKVLEDQSLPEQEQKLFNGHVDLSLKSTPQLTDQSQGVNKVPVKRNEGIAEARENGSSDTGRTNSYWRQSLILDLEGDEEEFDESLASEKSHPSPAGSPITPMDKEVISDEGESEEFFDSSEDEVIDHAADAKLGAVGGSSVEKYGSGDDEDNDNFDFGDKLDDGIGVDNDDDDGDDDDDDEDDLSFTGQSMVDGLCVSKPKEKRRKKSKKAKSSPKPRIQSAGSQYNTAVVLDNGSGIIKLGLAGSKTPTVVQPALYGIPKRYSLQMAGMDNKKDRRYGDSATARAGVMQLEYPMSSGFLDNWSDVEDIWENMLYNELGIEEGNHPILVTEVANTPKRNREKMAEILFEHLGVPAMYLANQLVLSLYASGLTVGMCLSSGFSVTQAAAIYEGHILAYTVQELDIGGKALTDNLQKLLRENKGHNFNSSSGWQIVNHMKEKMAYVAQDYSSEMKQFKTSDALTKFYSLPDGQTVDISSEMISAPEPLFNPETLLGADDTIASQMPIHKLVNRAFKRCSPDIQDSIYRNVVLSGGTTLTKGLVPRLEYEISKINPRIRSVRAPENRMSSAWIGGSILGSLSTLDSMYATIDEYADYGGRIVNQKCF